MLPLVTSQAIALSKAKQARARSRPQSVPEKPASAESASQSPKRTRFLWRVLNAIAVARLRRAAVELAYHRQLYEDLRKDEPSRPSNR
jgi:hypothetical protein